MKLLKFAGATLAGVAVLVVGGGLLLPSHAHLERTVEIAAPACNVYALVDNFGRFQEWSPWAGLDPATVYTYAGPERGVGASMHWVSQDERVGIGTQTIRAATECARVEHTLEFEGMGSSQAAMALTSGAPGTTKVVWSLDTDFGVDLVARYFGTQYDAMIGPDYERGLASLKAIAEAGPQVDIAGLSPEVVDVSASPIAFVATRSTRDPEAWTKAVGDAYGLVGVFMGTQGLTQSGPPVAVITAESNDGYAIDAGIPFNPPPTLSPTTDPDVRIGATPQGRALKLVHKGAYAGLEPLLAKAKAYMALRKLDRGGPIWEVYVSDPGTTDTAEVETDVYLLLKPAKG